MAAVVGAAAASWPPTIRAQGSIPVIGWLSGATADGFGNAVSAWRMGLKEAGYVPDQNVTIEYRWAEDKYERLPDLAAELVDRNVSVIAASGNAAARAAGKATASIPIVFHTGDDPVAVGLVTGLDQSSGNMTGVTAMAGELPAKRLELLHEMIPAARVGALVNPDNKNSGSDSAALQSAARALAIKLYILHATMPREIEAAFGALVRRHAGALLVNTDSVLTNQRNQIVALAARHRLPAIYSSSDFTNAGGLVSYGADRPTTYRQVGLYCGRILKGEKPADLPVQQPTKFALIINLKAARALGLTVPPTLLARADEVIE